MPALEIGTATQTVEVTAAPGAELQTLNSTMGTTLSGNILLSIPNQNRDATSLLVFQPTTAPTFGGAEGNVTGGQVAGSMSDQNTFSLDGGNATSDLEGDNNYVAGNRQYVGPQAAIPTPVESIEEFKVATNNQTADFSDSAGGQVMLVTKRGTNSWHGSGYDYFQADWLNAAGWSTDLVGAEKVKQHQNRFGGALGGPLGSKSFLGGKTYLYGNYEGRRYPNAQSRYERAVPSAMMRNGILQYRDANGDVNAVVLNSGTGCGPTGTGPCDPRGIGLNPLISQLWSKYEPPANDCSNSQPEGGDNLNICGFYAPLSLPIRDDFVVGRMDHDIGAKWRLNATYRFFRLVEPTTDQVDIGGLLPGDKLGVPASKSSDPGQPRYGTIGLTGTLTPTLTNNLTLSYLRNDWNWIRAGVPGGVLGVPGGIEVGGETGNSLDPLDMQTQQARFRTWNGHDYTVADTIAWLKSTHFIQMGGSYRHWWDNHVRDDNVTGSLSQLVYQIDGGSGLVMSDAYRPPACTDTLLSACIPSNGVWDGKYAEMMGFVGAANQLIVRGGSNFTATGAPYLQDHSITDAYSLYFTDSWKIKPNLTLNYGLDWEVQMPPYEQNGVQDYFVDSSGNGITYNSYIANVINSGNNGQVYNPTLGFEPIRGVAGSPKYPFTPWYGGFAPRVSLAYSPNFSSGVLGSIFGNKKTVIRGGYARIDDRSNAVNLVLTPLLGYGFGQPISCAGAGTNGICNGPGSTDPTNAFRIGVDGNTSPFPSVQQSLPLPVQPGVNSPYASTLFGLDNAFRPGINDTIDFSIQREIPGQMIVEVGYVGKWSKHLYLGMDAFAAPINLKVNGQTYAQAWASLFKANAAGTNPGAQPFFEGTLGGSSYCKGYANCTSAVLANEGSNGTGNIPIDNAYGLFADIDTGSTPTASTGIGAWNFGNCQSCSILPADVQAGAMDMSTTNGFANYQAGFVTVQKRTGHGLTLSGNLTWSHSLDTDGINQEFVEDSPNNIYNLRYDYAPSPFDRRWVGNILANYQLPFGKGRHFGTSNGFLDRLIGGWAFAPVFSAGTGIPVESYTGDCHEFGTGNIPWCAGAVPLANTGGFGHAPHLNVSTTAGVGAYNDTANGGTGGNLFANPTSVYNNYRFALLGQDTRSYPNGPFHGQSRWDIDFTIAKTTKITERVGTTFYAQFINAFNHMEYTDPSMNLQDPGDFGALYGQYNAPRTIELGLRVAF